MTAALLARALAALRSGGAEARALLIEAWRLRRSPVLAEAVDLLDTGSTDEIGNQIRAIVKLRIEDTRMALFGLAEIDDPRLATWALDTLANPPFSHRNANELYKDIVKTLRRLRDPRVADRLATIEAGLRSRGAFAMISDKLRDVGHLNEPPPPPSPEEHALESQITALLAPLAARPTEDAVLAEVYANPDDDGPRAVYADLLTGRGDPRGELIVLQLQRKQRGTVESARERTLIRKHGVVWLGKLAQAIHIPHPLTRFERGFVASAQLRSSFEASYGDRIGPGPPHEHVQDDPGWVTVEQLHNARLESCGPALKLLLNAPLRELRRLTPVIGSLPGVANILEQLAQRAEPLARVTELMLRDPTLEPALVHAALPGLTTLRLLLTRPSVESLEAFARYGADHVVIEQIDRGADEQLIAALPGSRAWTAQLSVRLGGQDWAVFRRAANGQFRLTGTDEDDHADVIDVG